MKKWSPLIRRLRGVQFINKLTGIREEGAANQLQPHTQDIEEYIVNLSNNRQYVFVDTPGFNNPSRSDRDIQRTIAGWLEKK